MGMDKAFPSGQIAGLPYRALPFGVDTLSR